MSILDRLSKGSDDTTQRVSFHAGSRYRNGLASASPNRLHL
jgi:hypothetical protein